MSTDVKVSIKVDAGDARKNVENLGAAAETAAEQVFRLRDANVSFLKSGAEAASAASAATKSVSAFGRLFESTFGQFTLAGIAANAITGGLARVQQGFLDAINTGAKYQSKLNELSAITGIAGSDLDALGDAAIQNARETGVAIEQQIEAYKLLASNIDVAKIGGTQGLKALQKEVITLSQAAGIDLVTASNAVASTLNQFSLEGTEAARVVNVLAAGSKFGAAEVGDLAAAMKQAGTTAALSGQSVETTVAALEVLSQNALKGAEAGTGLRNVMTILNTEADKLAKAGITEVNLQTDGLTGTLMKLTPLLDNANALVDIFGRENLNAAQILIKNASAVTEMERRVTGTTTAMEQAAIQTQGFEAAQRRLKAAYDAAAVTLFRQMEPALTAVITATANLISPATSAADKVAEMALHAIELDKSVSPLLTRLDELQSKASLNAKEQNELNGILSQLERQLPITALKFDAYGKIIGVNTEKAAAFVKQQKELSLITNQDFLRSKITQIQTLAGQWTVLSGLMQQLNEGKQVRSTAVVDVLFNGGMANPARIKSELSSTVDALKVAFAEMQKVGVSIDDIAVKFNLPPQQVAQLKTLAEQFGLVSVASADASEGIKGAGEASVKTADGLVPLSQRVKELTAQLDELLSKADWSDADLQMSRKIRTELDAVEQIIETRKAQIEQKSNAQPLFIKVLPKFIESTFTGPLPLKPITLPVKPVMDPDAGPSMLAQFSKWFQQNQAVIQGTQSLLGGLSSYANAVSNAKIAAIQREEAAVMKRYDTEEQRIRRNYDTQLRNIDSQLQSESLSEGERRRLVDERRRIEANYEGALNTHRAARLKAEEESEAKIRAAKRKAAESEKRWALTNAIMQGAVQIASVAGRPWLLGLTAAAVALQVAAIRKQPIPEFAQGGQIPVRVSNGEFYAPPAMAAAYLPLLQALNSSPAAARQLQAGFIAGPGTATSDSIIAMAQPGGYVVNAASTQASRAILSNIARGYYTGGSIAPAPNINVSPASVNLDQLVYEFRRLRSDFENLSLSVHGRELKLLLDKENQYQSNSLRA